MKKFCLVLFLMVGLFGLVACNAEDDSVVEDSAVEDVENSVDDVESPEVVD